MNLYLKTFFLLLLSQIIFAKKCIVIETKLSKGVISQKDLSKENGDFIPNRKQIIKFESTLQKALKEIKVGDTVGLSIPKHILNLNFSNYYRKYSGLDSNRINTRIFVTFIPKDKIENICDEETWIKLLDSKERFTISYYLKSDTMLCHPKREE